MPQPYSVITFNHLSLAQLNLKRLYLIKPCSRSLNRLSTRSRTEIRKARCLSEILNEVQPPPLPAPASPASAASEDQGYRNRYNLIDRPSPNVSTTPLQQWGFWQCLPFSWTTLMP